MSESDRSRAKIDAWQAHELRATFFATPDALPMKPQGWWQAAVGTAPERIEDRPNILLHIEEGPFPGGLLTLTVQADRIDWAVLRPRRKPSSNSKCADDGPVPDGRDAFLSKAWRWVPSALQPCRRVAFGLVYSFPFRAGKAGYCLLAAYLPFAPDPHRSTRPKYQINRQRRSQLKPDLLINRLQNWAVASFRKTVRSSAASGCGGRSKRGVLDSSRGRRKHRCRIVAGVRRTKWRFAPGTRRSRHEAGDRRGPPMSPAALVQPRGLTGTCWGLAEFGSAGSSSVAAVRVTPQEAPSCARTTGDPVPWDEREFEKCPGWALASFVGCVACAAQRGVWTERLFPLLFKGPSARKRLVYEMLREFADPRDILVNSLVLYHRYGDAEPMVIAAGLLEDLGARSCRS